MTPCVLKPAAGRTVPCHVIFRFLTNPFQPKPPVWSDRKGYHECIAPSNVQSRVELASSNWHKSHKGKSLTLINFEKQQIWAIIRRSWTSFQPISTSVGLNRVRLRSPIRRRRPIGRVKCSLSIYVNFIPVPRATHTYPHLPTSGNRLGPKS